MKASIGKALIVAIAIVAGLAGRATAVPITFEFRATITSFDSELAPLFSGGEQISGTYTFDSTATGTNTSLGTTYDLGVMTLAVETATSTLTGSSTGGSIGVANDRFGLDGYAVRSTNFSASQSGFTLGAAGLGLVDTSATAFDSEALPGVPPNISDFNFDIQITAYFNDVHGVPRLAVASLDYLETPTSVPESSTLVLMGVGLGALSARAWSRRRRK